MTRPEWVHCVRTVEGSSKTFCGRDLPPWEWAFVDAEHAKNAVEQGTRLVPCEGCMANIPKSS